MYYKFEYRTVPSIINNGVYVGFTLEVDTKEQVDIVVDLLIKEGNYQVIATPYNTEMVFSKFIKINHVNEFIKTFEKTKNE